MKWLAKPLQNLFSDLRNEQTLDRAAPAAPLVTSTAFVDRWRSGRCAVLWFCPNCNKSIPHPCTMGHAEAMNPLAAFAFLIATVQSLVAAVTTRDNLHLRPALAAKAVAARLVSGLRVLRAFLRRLIILIALDMEWGLVDTRGAMKRPHGRQNASSSRPSLQGLDANTVSPWLNGDGPAFNAVFKTGYSTPIQVDMAWLYAQLDFLARIAANPNAQAKRLAFHLARSQHGIIMAPKGPERLAGRWGTEVRASYDAMAGSIITQSRNRPPPLTPPRNYWPTITAL